MPNDVEGLIEKLEKEAWGPVGSDRHVIDFDDAVTIIRQYFNAPEGKGEEGLELDDIVLFGNSPLTEDQQWLEDTKWEMAKAIYSGYAQSTITPWEESQSYHLELFGYASLCLDAFLRQLKERPAPPGREQQPPASPEGRSEAYGCFDRGPEKYQGRLSKDIAVEELTEQLKPMFEKQQPPASESLIKSETGKDFAVRELQESGTLKPTSESDTVGELTLGECPEGLFLFDGDLGFKSEYKTESESSKGFWQSDAYCVGSGEYFWGGTDDAVKREKLLVTPVDEESVLALINARAVPEGKE